MLNEAAVATSRPRYPSSAIDLAILQRPPDRHALSLLRNVAIYRDGALDLRAARRIGGIAPAWIAPRADGTAVCRLTLSFVACTPWDEIERRGASVNVDWHADSGFIVSGIADDATLTIRIITYDRRRLEIPVMSNSYSVELARPPRKVLWHGPSGREHFRFAKRVLALLAKRAGPR